MFLFSPEKYEPFEKYWREQFGIDADVEPKELGVRNLYSRQILDAPVKLHKEFTSWSDSTGSFAVAYMGIEGTYEWNRPHFIDFLRTVVITPGSRPNDVLHRTPPLPEGSLVSQGSGERGH